MKTEEDNLIKDIAKKIRWIQKEIEKALPTIKEETDDIINTEDRLMRRIESQLDKLLDYVDLGLGESEFKRLNSYYASFNKENAAAYERFYKEATCEDEDLK